MNDYAKIRRYRFLIFFKTFDSANDQMFETLQVLEEL